MRRTMIPTVLFAALFTIIPLFAQSQDAVITTIAEINSVNEEGMPTFPGLQTMDRYTIEGIALNDPAIFNSETDRSFILYVQDDTGGIQCYAGAWYGSGLDYYPSVQAGDRVRVTGLTGHFGGKTNINERHNPDQKFDVEILESGPLPDPMPIDDLEEASRFDHARQSGGEHYQGRLAVLRNVRIVDGEWANGAKLTVQDVRGAEFPVELRFHTRIGDHPQPQGLLHIVGVFNQEDTEAPFTEGYLLWPRSIEDFLPVEESAVDGWDVYR